MDGPLPSSRGRWAHAGRYVACAVAVAAAVAVLVLAPGFGRGALAQSPADPCPGNVLANGGFESGFTGRGRPGLTVADGWEPWYERFPGVDGINYVPDYTPVHGEETPFGVAAGLWSQELATHDATHTAGLWQRAAVPPGSLVSARVLAHAWATAGTDPVRSQPPGTYVVALGLDPTGGQDPNATTVAWTQPISITDLWVPLGLSAAVEGDAATVFLRGQPTLRLRHNVSRWDAACLQVVGVVGEPTATPTRPPWPTRTPLPGTPSAAPTASPTADAGTQTALDVGLFLDHAATTEAGGGAGVSLEPPDAEPDLGAVPTPFYGDVAELAPPGPAEALWGALADRAGLIVLAVAALVGGVLVGARRSGGVDDEGGRA